MRLLFPRWLMYCLGRDPDERTIATVGRTYPLSKCPVPVLEGYYALSDADMADTLNEDTDLDEMRLAVAGELARRGVIPKARTP